MRLPELPQDRLSRLIPNALTVVRVPIAIAGAWALIVDLGALAAWLYLVGYLTDVADGFAARSLRSSSPQGRRLDGLADVAFHALFGVGIAYRAAAEGMWWVIGVLAALVLGERIMRRWIRAYSVTGKAIGGVYRIVMFALLVVLSPQSRRTSLIIAGALVMIITYTYEGWNTLRELHAGERSAR